MDEEEKKAIREKFKRRKATPLAYRIVIDSFDEIDDFNCFMKTAIRREKHLTSEHLDKGAEGLEGEALQQYWEIFAEDYQIIGSVFEKFALDSFIVMLYSRLESGMATLCDALRQDKQNEKGEMIGLRYTDLKGSGYLDQAKSYMEKVIGLNLDLGNNPQWPEIVALKALRNAIVHEEGWLSTKNATLKKHIKQGLLELRKQKEENGQISGWVIVTTEYIDFVLPLIRTFFQNIKI